MDAYLDISFIFTITNILTLPYFYKKILSVKISAIELISLISFNLVLYFNAFLFSNYRYMNLIFLIVYFFVVYRANFIKYLFIYILIYYSNISYALMISKDIYLYRGVILINNPASFIWIITIVVNIIFIEIIMLTIRSIKLLHNYKMNVEIEIFNHIYYLSGYMDSGNTLIKGNLPVVFISDSYLKGDGFKEMIVKGVGTRKCKYIEGKIKIDNVSKDVIYAFVDDINFKGCECLLNINLMEEKL